MNKTVFEHLKRWELPSHYAGAQWPDYFSFLGRSRDSDILERANFDAGLAMLGGESETVLIVRESHWAVGWVEWIAIHESNDKALQIAEDVLGSLEDYCVVDEDLFSDYEIEEANQVWANCYDVSERIAYIREYRSQFEFRDFSDLVHCVRGNYFCGYAGELISR